MQSTLKEIESISYSRHKDYQNIVDGNIQGLTMNYFLDHQKSRCSKENLHFFLLKKNKFFTSDLKAKLLNLSIKIIKLFYPETQQLTAYDQESTEIGFQDFYELINKFTEIAKIGMMDKLNSILRPNNQTLIADTICLILEQTRIMLKKNVFSVFSKNRMHMKINTDDSLQILMKNPPGKQKKVSVSKRMHTEVIQAKFKKIEGPTNTFESEYREYVRQKRQEFVENFNKQELTNKLNNDYVELVKLNIGQKQIIQKYYEGFAGRKLLALNSKNHGNLYTNSEKQNIIKDMQAKLQSNRQRMQAYPGETASAQELKQYIKAYIENRLSTFQMMKNLGILKQLQIQKINQWLPFGCFTEDNDEFSLRLFMEDSDDIQKSFKSYHKSQSVISVLNNKLNQMKDIRLTDNMRYIPDNKKYRKEIVWCFNRKKIKQMLEGPKISPQKRRQESNSSTVLLPTINHRAQRSLQKVDQVRVSLKATEKVKSKLSLKKIENRNMHSDKIMQSKGIPTSNLTFNFINM